MHAHGPPQRRRLLVTFVVTATLMLTEFVGGWLSGSLALLADAGHMLTDLLALSVAVAAVSLSERPADPRNTYGYRRLEILAALANGVLLVVISGSIAWEALDRWMHPRPIDIPIMAAVAAAGLAANLVGLWMLRKPGHNLNLRAAFLHMLGDALTSVGVLVAALVVALTGWQRIDALISWGIAITIVITSVALLRDVFNVLLEAAPRGIDTEQVRTTIRRIAGVDEVHDLHVWSITSGLPALSAHVIVTDPGSDQHVVLRSIQDRLRSEFDIHHATLQIEARADEDCGRC